jgi:hypothetical protein
MSNQFIIRWNVAAIAVIGLGSFAFRSLSAQQESRSDSSAAHFSIGSAQTMLGIVQFKFGDLNERLATAGLPRVATSVATIGLGADIRSGRALFGGGFQSMLSRDQTETAYRTRMSGGYSLFDVGYAVVSTRRTAVYPVVGVGVTHVSVSIKELGDFNFDDGLHTPARELSMSGTSALAHASLMIEQRFHPSAGVGEFALTARVGIIGNVGTQSWQSDESQVRGGPTAVRGSYLRVAFSKPLHTRRDAALPMAGTLLQTILK